MSDDPAERLRQSNQISIPGVLDVGDSDDAAEMTAMMSEVVQIPVRVEWVAGRSSSQMAQAPARPAQRMEPHPDPASTRGTPAETPNSMAPILARPPVRRGRFITEN